jgi:hypothetical protein
MAGYFEGLDPARRPTRWRCGSFLGYELSEATPDHSTISRTRRLVETHRDVFGWVLRVVDLILEKERDKAAPGGRACRP